MRKFAALFDAIDQTQSANQKILHMQNYFLSCSDGDGAWALFFLCGRRLKRLITGRQLLQWCCQSCSYPNWLMEEAYAAVGDVAETVALLLPRKEKGQAEDLLLSDWMNLRLKPLKKVSLIEQKEAILAFWSALSTKEILVLNKILTGSFRLGVSHLLTLKALSLALGVSKELLSQRLMGSWEPTAEFFASLKIENENEKHLNPYPFYLAYPFEGDLKTLGQPSQWLAEWKWDGIRAQVVVREGIALWSRGNELISDQFPELVEAFKGLPSGTVLDGEILAFQDQLPLPFSALQTRLGRKNVSKSMIEKVPLIFMAYDLLEYKGKDLRPLPLKERRLMLTDLISLPEKMQLSVNLNWETWEELLELRQEARKKATEGIMLKKWSSAYGVGRQKGHWWKYKVDPLTIDAVLLYAQAGSGVRANLFTDYTFGIWKDQQLIPIAKAYSGLDQKEIQELDQWIKKNTEEKFGPVRKVKAFHVFEIAFEGIQKSKRHKSGLALRFPRILRWRKDKQAKEGDTLHIILESFFSDEL